jgi:hypothetical protein
VDGGVGRFGGLQVAAVDGDAGQASPQRVVLDKPAQLESIRPPGAIFRNLSKLCAKWGKMVILVILYLCNVEVGRDISFSM